MDPMLEAFLSESRDLLETAGQCFLELEKTPDDPERLNDLFRSMHTIKGSSGLFEVQPLTQVVHAAEDVLDRVREGSLRLDSEMVDLFLEAMDHVSTWLDALEADGELGDGAGEISRTLSSRLRQLIDEQAVPLDTAASDTEPGAEAETAPASEARESPPMPESAAPEWLASVPDAIRRDLYTQATNGRAAPVAIEYLPAEQCFFSGDDPLFTATRLPGRCWLGVGTRAPWPELGSFDPYRCQLRLRLLSDAGREAVEEHLRYVSEEVSITPLQPLQLVCPAGEEGEPEAYEAFLEDAPPLIGNRNWSALASAIDTLLEVSAPELYQSSALRWMQAVTRSPEPDPGLATALLDAIATGEFHLPRTPAASGPSPVPDGVTSEIRELLQAQTELLACTEETAAPSGNIAAVSTVLDNLLPRLGRAGQRTQVAEAAALPVEQAAERLSRIILDLLGENAFSPRPQTEEDPRRTAARELLQAQEDLLSLPVRAETWEGILASSANVMRAAMGHLGHQDLVAGIDQAMDQARQQHSGRPLRDLIAQVVTCSRQETRPTEDRAGGGTATPPKSEVWDGRERRQSRPVLKVDQARIDTLMDLVGELVVAKNALPYLERQAEEEFGCAPLAKAIKAQYGVINRIAEELQTGVMQVRMVPVSTVFQRFPRLVRDLSRKLHKRIRLVMEGEETEIDKNVVEDLPDPLVHLIRNSIDHGIETPAEREAAGKSAEGTITLRATPLDDQVLIEIVDDGKGIDPAVIKRKAYEKGLIDEDRLDTISDQESLQLILAPGFSTAEQVTDLSGRGVGMDVVNTMVAKIGGTVRVNSRPGAGSTIRLALPLSMAVTQVMMVDAGGDSFGVPLEAVVETVKVPADSVQHLKHHEMVVLRERLIPLLHLDRVLDLRPGESPDEDKVAVLVVRVEGQELGLVVDRFHAGMDVILKPLEGILSGFHHFSGTALLGDGRVLLVLNLTELLRCR